MVEKEEVTKMINNDFILNFPGQAWKEALAQKYTTLEEVAEKINLLEKKIDLLLPNYILINGVWRSLR